MFKRIVSVFLTGVLLLLCGCVSTLPEDGYLSGESSGYSRADSDISTTTTTTTEATATSTETTTETTTTETTISIETTTALLLDPSGSYTTKEDVSLYLYTYGELPQNFITKKEAQCSL